MFVQIHFVMVNSTLNTLRLDIAMSYGKSKSTSEDEQYIDITTTHNVLSLCTCRTIRRVQGVCKVMVLSHCCKN